MRRASLRTLLSFLGGNWLWFIAATIVTLAERLVDSLGLSLVVTTAMNGAVTGDIAMVKRATLGLAAVGGGRAIFMALSGYLLARSAEGAARNLRRRIVARSLAAAEQDAAPAQPGQTVAVLVNDVELAKQGFSNLLNAIGQLFTVATVFVALSLWEWPVALAAAVMALACFASTAGFAGALKRLGAAYQNGLGRVTELATNLISGMTVIKSLRAETAMTSRFRNANDDLYAVGQRRGTVLGYQSLTANGIPWLALAGLIAVTGALAIGGRIPVGDAVGLVQLGTRALFPLAIFGSVWAGLQANLAAADRVDAALHIPIEEPAGRPRRRLTGRGATAATAALVPAGAAGLAFDAVTFNYGDHTVFADTTFAVPNGGRMSLHGPSGSGKTTAMKLMLGLCRPQSGRISIAGQDAGSLAPGELRRLIAYVPQEPWLFPGSVRDNIALGKPAASETEIIAAAQAAHAHDFISRLPQGYDTVLDERGSNLSGGERQRLCLARALLKDAPLLLLDEATSAVDAESERLIRAAVDELGRTRTVVTVSHTDEMSRGADVAVALE